MGMILRIASSRIVGQGDIVGRSGYFSLNLSANSVMRGRLDARRTLKSLVADLRLITKIRAMEFKSQICTTHEQSKRLLALGLKPETADMVYHHTKSKVPALEWELQTKPPTLRGKFWTPQRIAKLAFPFHKHPDGSPMAGEEVFDRLWGEDVPAWSLCRLLELLPTEIRIGTSENVFGLHHETSDAWLLSYPYVKSFETASPVESCVLAIDWLIANGHFNKEYYNEENNVQ